MSFRSRHGLAIAAASLLVLLTVSPAAAEEPDAGEAQPAADAPLDLIGYLDRLRAQLEEHEPPPARTATNRALYDAWRAILKPRAARMVRRVERVAERKRWIVVPATGEVRHLAPEEWSRVIREMASLYTELGGALEQYERVAIKYRPLQGVPAGPPSDVSLQGSLAHLRALESAFARRRAHGGVIWADERLHYDALVRQVAAAQALYERRLRRWQEAVAAIEDIQQRVVGGLEMKRQSLAFQMLSVRALVAGLQSAEEERLRVAVSALPATKVPDAAKLLGELQEARRAAEAHQEEPAKYGTILRQKWLGARRELMAYLRQAAEDDGTD